MHHLYEKALQVNSFEKIKILFQKNLVDFLSIITIVSTDWRHFIVIFNVISLFMNNYAQFSTSFEEKNSNFPSELHIQIENYYNRNLFTDNFMKKMN